MIFNIILLSGVKIVFSQSLLREGQFGGSNTEIGNNVVADTNGNVYTIGTFDGTVDFDPGIVVYNLNGNLVYRVKFVVV